MTSAVKTMHYFQKKKSRGNFGLPIRFSWAILPEFLKYAVHFLLLLVILKHTRFHMHTFFFYHLFSISTFHFCYNFQNCCFIAFVVQERGYLIGFIAL